MLILVALYMELICPFMNQHPNLLGAHLFASEHLSRLLCEARKYNNHHFLTSPKASASKDSVDFYSPFPPIAACYFFCSLMSSISSKVSGCYGSFHVRPLNWEFKLAGTTIKRGAENFLDNQEDYLHDLAFAVSNKLSILHSSRQIKCIL